MDADVYPNDECLQMDRGPCQPSGRLGSRLVRAEANYSTFCVPPLSWVVRWRYIRGMFAEVDVCRTGADHNQMSF